MPEQEPSKPVFPPELNEEYNALTDELNHLRATTPQTRDAITEEHRAAHRRMQEITARRMEINAIFETIRQAFYEDRKNR